jgi:DNA polymerase III delta prime subunit
VQEITFNFTDIKTKTEMMPKIVKRLENILVFEKVEYNKETLEKLVTSFYPDMRKMINLLQQYSNTYGVVNNDIFNYQDIEDEFYNYILSSQLTKARKYLIDRNLNPEEVYRKLFDNLVPKLQKDKQAQAIITIAQYGYQNAFTVDKEINLTACLLELIGLL